MTTIKNGDTVKVHYTGKLTNGEVFDSSLSEGREPLQSQLGKEELIPGFEAGLIGMAKGEKKTITIPCADAYGDYRNDMVIPVPIEQLPEGIEKGMQLQVMTPYGPQLVTVKDITETEGLIDHNHQLAGQDLIFDLEVVSFTEGVHDAVIIEETKNN